MSGGVWKLVFRPLEGSFDLGRQSPTVVDGGGAARGGTVIAGTLIFPSGVILQVTEGIAVLGSGTITLDPFSEIVVLL